MVRIVIPMVPPSRQRKEPVLYLRSATLSRNCTYGQLPHLVGLPP